MIVYMLCRCTDESRCYWTALYRREIGMGVRCPLCESYLKGVKLNITLPEVFRKKP